MEVGSLRRFVADAVATNEFEAMRALARFGAVMGNWYAIMSRQKKLSFFTAGYSQISTVLPVVMVSPAYFAGALNLGGLMQTATAFGSVQQALSFFVTSYRQIAEWRAVIDRLSGFEKSMKLRLRSTPSSVVRRSQAKPCGLIRGINRPTRNRSSASSSGESGIRLILPLLVLWTTRQPF